MSSKKIPTPEELFKKYSNLLQFEEGSPEYYVDKEDFIQALKEYAKETIKYTLERAADEGKVLMIPNCDDHTPYWGACVSCGRIDNPDIPMEQIDKESILSLEQQIIKDLGL